MAVLRDGTLLNGGMFIVGALLSSGGMGEVYLGHQRSMRRYVAIKILKPEYAADAQVLALFQREALAAGRLRHPNVLPVIHFDFDSEVGVHFLAMDYVPGGHTLAERLGGRLDPAEVARVIEGIAGALDAAHAHGIVHRDVKPANVLLDGDRPLLTDFGIAHLEGLTGKATSRGMGTSLYMAPERWESKRDDGRSDQYSLAVIAYEMLSGRPPFLGDPPALGYQHVNVPPPSLAELTPHVSPTLEQVILRGMAKRPEDRYGSCGEFANALRNAVGLEPASEAATSPGTWMLPAQAPAPATPVMPGGRGSTVRPAPAAARRPRPPATHWLLRLRAFPRTAAILAVAALGLGLGVVSIVNRATTPSPPVRSGQPTALATTERVSTVTGLAPEPERPDSDSRARESPAGEVEDAPLADVSTPTEPWLMAAATLDEVWAEDWPSAIAVLDIFLESYPGHPAAHDKLYAALVEYGRELISRGLRLEGASQLVRAQALQPGWGEAEGLLLALTPTAVPTPLPLPATAIAPPRLPTAAAPAPRPAPPGPAPTATLRPPPIGP